MKHCFETLKFLLAVLQNFTVTDQIQKVAEAFQCKPVEGNLIISILLYMIVLH